MDTCGLYRHRFNKAISWHSLNERFQFNWWVPNRFNKAISWHSLNERFQFNWWVPNRFNMSYQEKDVTPSVPIIKAR